MNRFNTGKWSLLTLSVLLLAGCATTTGLPPTVSKSGFDNARIVSMEPHSNASSSIITTGLGAQWNGTQPDRVILIVAVFNVYTGITSAELNIDGVKVMLDKTGTVTDTAEIGGVKISSNGFVTDLDTVEKILKSKRTWLRVLTPTGTLENAVIDGPTDSKAYHALERFMTAVKAGP